MHKTPNLAQLSTPRSAQACPGLCHARSARPCACCRALSGARAPAAASPSALRAPSAARLCPCQRPPAAYAPRARLHSQLRPCAPSTVPLASALCLLAQRPRTPCSLRAQSPAHPVPSARTRACLPTYLPPQRPRPCAPSAQVLLQIFFFNFFFILK